VNGSLSRAEHHLARIAVAALAVLMLTTVCTRSGEGTPTGGSSGAETATGAEQGREEPGAVRDLASIATLQDQFNRDAGTVRLILLISPT
jgi:hypothetical protein